MSSHVPFLAVRPDDQYSTDVKTRDFAITTASTDPIAVAMDAASRNTPARTSHLSPYIRFPLVCIISLGLSSLLYSLVSDLSGYQFATASRRLEADWQVGALLVWKVVQLGVAWSAGYDYVDLAALTLLTNQPYYYLLHSFFSVQLIPIVISIAIDLAIFAVPFGLLRERSRIHDTAPAKTTNQAIAQDTPTLALTAGLAACVYAVTFYISYYANLGSFLIIHFDELPSLESAHDPSLGRMIALFSLSGAAAMSFLFRPTVAVTSPPNLTEPKARGGRGKQQKRFSAETATLGETFAYNLGYGESGWSKRAEVLAKRTAVLILCTAANTTVRVGATVQGADLVGALGYAALWSLAHVGVGVAYGWLGNEV